MGLSLDLNTSIDWDDRTFAGSLFHSLGAATAKALSPPQHNFKYFSDKRFKISFDLKPKILSHHDLSSSAKYSGACPVNDLQASNNSLNVIRYFRGNQCNSIKSGVI